MCRLALLIVILAAMSCSPRGGTRTTVGGAQDGDLSNLPLSQIQSRAEAGDASAQRTLAGRLLFTSKPVTPQDIATALEWTEKAALGGDPTAAVWMGRKFLDEPETRTTAGGWFLAATQSGDPAASQDAKAELEALSLDSKELATAQTLATEIRKSFIIQSK